MAVDIAWAKVLLSASVQADALLGRPAEPVRVADALRAATPGGNRRFVELGPGTALAALIRRGSQREPVSAVSIGAHAGGPFAGLAGVLGRLWTEGTPVDWDMITGAVDQRFA